MPPAYSIIPALSDADVRAVADLFARYAPTLPMTLDYQDFDAELAGLPGKYAAPHGALLLARGPDGAALGCVAVRALAEPGVAEMKRLFLLPAARGLGLGRALAQAAIDEARRLGFGMMRLDTLAGMDAAIGLYRALGFTETPAYYAPTPAGTLFMARAL